MSPKPHTTPSPPTPPSSRRRRAPSSRIQKPPRKKPTPPIPPAAIAAITTPTTTAPPTSTPTIYRTPPNTPTLPLAAPAATPARKLSSGQLISSDIVRTGAKARTVCLRQRDERAAAAVRDAEATVARLRGEGRHRAASTYEADIQRVVAEFVEEGDRQLKALTAKYQQLAAAAYVKAIAQEESEAGREEGDAEGKRGSRWLDTVMLRA